MALISQAGSLNTTALTVPDLYVQIVPPGILALNGVPTNTIGIVGTASWGPVGQGIVFGTDAERIQNFGMINARKYDMGTQASTAILQGASSFVGVRVTDGSDTAASIPIEGNSTTMGLVLTALYSGTTGNSITVTINNPGAKGTGYADIIVQCPPMGTVEAFNGIPSATASAFWYLAAPALNGQAVPGWTPNRGASQLIVAAVGANASALPPITGTQVSATLAGGTDGVTNVTQNTLIGIDGTARTGMYALRGQGCSIGVLADGDLASTFTTQIAFGLGEGVYMIGTGPSGATIAAAVSGKQAAGVDSYAMKIMFGDWINWYDPVNQLYRYVSPQGFAAGRLANLAPQQSSLNKPIYGIVNSQKSGQGQQIGNYSSADLQTLFGAGIDVISNPQPGGSYWGCRGGFNTSSNAGIDDDSYTRLTNYVAATLAAGMGEYVGELINLTLFGNIRATLLGYLGNLLQQGVLGSLDGSTPYGVVCDNTNNPQSRTAIGYVQADVQVQYQGVNKRFLVNLQGGAGVTVTQPVTSGLGGVVAG